MAFALRQPYGRRAGRARAENDEAAAEAGPRRAGTARVAAGRGAWAVGSVLVLIARIVRILASLIAALIVAAIVLRVLGANPGNAIVSGIHDAARAFVGPFKNIFTIKDAKLAIVVNWGIAAIVYLLVGSIIARLIARIAPRGLPPGERVA
jgi:hypothetical protein